MGNHFRILILFLFIFVLVFPCFVLADWSTTFIQGVNSTNANDGEINFVDSSELHNAPTDGKLPAPIVNDEGKACYRAGGFPAKKCKKSNTVAQLPTGGVEFSQCESNSGNNVGPPTGGNPTITVTEGEYGDVKLDNGANNTLRFTTDNGVYRLKTLQAKTGRLELSSGQYWIGSLEISEDVVIVFPTTGSVSFFIEGGYTLENDDSPADPTQFLIYTYDDFKINNNLSLSAYVFAVNDILFEDGAELNGAATGYKLTFNSGSKVNYIARSNEISLVPDCDAVPEPLGIDHYRIEFTSSALSCTAKDIRLRACDNDDCSTESNIETSVELTKNGTKYNDVVFTGNGQTQLWHTEGGLVSIGLGITSPTGPYFCYIDGGLVGSENIPCPLSFADAGFIFNIDNFISNKSQGNIDIFAVKKSDSSTQCVPTFASVSKTVNFWSQYVTPTSADIVAAQSVAVNNTNIGKSDLNITPLTLFFDNQGKAEFELNYSDAGRIAIHAKYIASAGEDDEGLIMEGVDDTVRYPAGLCIKPEMVCTTPICPAFKLAGENFDMSIQAMAWQSDGDTDYCDNLATPNYVQANIILGSQLEQPADGAVGEVGLNTYNHAAIADNLNTLEQSITEVGIFTFSATPPTGYLGESINILIAKSDPVGRFYPNDFEIYDNSMIAACGAGGSAFTYMDEPVSLMMTIRARNLSGDTTQNYFGDFASGTAQLVAENSNVGVSYQTRLVGLTALSWDKLDQGIQLVDNNIKFTRLLNSNLDGPYTSMVIGLQMIDNDGVLIASPDMNAGTADDCSISDSCDAKQLSTQHYRYGRIVLTNAYGPETDILRMPVTAEYWNSTQWGGNTLDNCTDIVLATLPVTGVVYKPEPISTQTVTRIGSTNTVPESDFSQGRFELLWQSLISTPNRYRGQVTTPLAVPLWLKWYWNYDNDGTLSDPRASAFFGTYRGHDKMIYWREVN